MEQEGDFPRESNETSDEDFEENDSEDSEIDSETDNCSATALIDALSNIPQKSQFQDLTSKDRLPDDFLLKSFKKVRKFFKLNEITIKFKTHLNNIRPSY